jgi:ABC-2 type transport system ATP-binding protein
MCNRVIIINNGKIVADDHISALQSEQATEAVEGLIIEWRQEISEATLNSFKYVEKMEPLAQGKWLFKSKNPELLRKEILNWSVTNNLDILSLQKEQTTLEDTFRNLTK